MLRKTFFLGNEAFFKSQLYVQFLYKSLNAFKTVFPDGSFLNFV